MEGGGIGRKRNAPEPSALYQAINAETQDSELASKETSGDSRERSSRIPSIKDFQFKDFPNSSEQSVRAV